jgi:DNA-binding PadR family transcriptional regulator
MYHPARYLVKKSKMPLRYAILGLLAETPRSGYELLREFDYSRSVIWPAPQNEIYRELAKLQHNGWIEQPAAAGARNRRIYRITPSGKKILHQWLCSDTVDFSLRYEPVLRAVFMTQMSKEEIKRRLERDLEFFEKQLELLRSGTTSEEPARADFHERRRYARRLAIGLYEALAHWCRESLTAPRSEKISESRLDK